MLLQSDTSGSLIRTGKVKSIVEQVGQEIEKTSQWRITLTDYFGGRGQDYRVTDKTANLNGAFTCPLVNPVSFCEDFNAPHVPGGLMVIAAHIPVNRREWIQWLGRTARQDKSGQYAIVLDSQDELYIKVEEKNTQEDLEGMDARTLGEKMVKDLLEARDEDVEEKLNKLGSTLDRGIKMNELCEAFYSKYGNSDADHWPNGPEETALRDLLEDDGSIDTFRQRWLS